MSLPLRRGRVQHGTALGKPLPEIWFDALVRERRSDRGQRRALSAKLRQVVEALALEKPPLPIAALHRQICKIAPETDQNVPTYKAVYRIVRELPKDLLVLAHEGTKAYAEAFDLIHRSRSRSVRMLCSRLAQIRL